MIEYAVAMLIDLLNQVLSLAVSGSLLFMDLFYSVCDALSSLSGALKMLGVLK